MLPILLATLETEEEQRFLTQFYLKYKAEFYRYALSILQNPHLAEEAVQEGWMKCVKNADRFFQIPLEKRKAWMVILLKHICLTMLQKESRTTSLTEDWDLAAPEPGDHRGVVDLIRTMPQQYRTILELKFVLEWPDKAIAKELHLPVTTVSTRISRGRKLLQEQLIKEGYWHEHK